MKSGISNSILDAIGNTPMLEVEGILLQARVPEPFRVYQGHGSRST